MYIVLGVHEVVICAEWRGGLSAVPVQIFNLLEMNSLVRSAAHVDACKLIQKLV